MNKITIKRDESLYLREASLYMINSKLDDKLNDITFTEARLSNDYSYLTLYFTILNKDNLDFYSDLLLKYEKQIRHHLANSVNTFKMPNIIFKYDDSLDYGNKIDTLLKSINKE